MLLQSNLFQTRIATEYRHCRKGKLSERMGHKANDLKGLGIISEVKG
jgi:hypothetical protein